MGYQQLLYRITISQGIDRITKKIWACDKQGAIDALLDLPNVDIILQDIVSIEKYIPITKQFVRLNYRPSSKAI